MLQRTISATCVLALCATIQAAPALRGQSSVSDESMIETNAQTVLGDTLAALGGVETFEAVSGMTYQASAMFHSQTLTQNYNLKHSDQSVSQAGLQNMSFTFKEDGLRQRIDRTYRYNDYWLWAHPDLEPPINFSLVLKDGVDGYACFLKGQNTFYAEDPSEALGYADPSLTDYLIEQAHKFALPWLLRRLIASQSSVAVFEATDPISRLPFFAIRDADLNIALLIGTKNHLPYAVRTYETHPVFGNSTSDLLLSDFRHVQFVNSNGSQANILLPHHFQTVYNDDAILEEFMVDVIEINPSFNQDYFEPLPAAGNGSPLSHPSKDPDYPLAEVHEMFEAGLWSGPFNMFNVSDVVVEQPLVNIPQIRSVYVGYPDYVQLVVEFEDGVLITDAPAHRSKIIMQWVKETIKKPITHIVPSHHHRDHAGGVGDYLAAGAALVVPEVSTEFYNKVNDGNVHMVTYNSTHPFVLRDHHVQFRSMWRDENPHARDWTYSIATSACPTNDDGIAAYVVDVVNFGDADGKAGQRWDSAYARQWLISAAEDGLPNLASTMLVGSHGATKNGTSTTGTFGRAIEAIGMSYPELSIEDWKAGGPLCS